MKLLAMSALVLLSAFACGSTPPAWASAFPEARYTAIYRLVIESGETRIESDVLWYRDGADRNRLDIRAADASSTIVALQSDTRTALCRNTAGDTAGVCFDTGDFVKLFDPRTVKDQTSTSSTRSVAGEDARCVAPEESSFIDCYARDGVVLYSSLGYQAFSIGRYATLQFRDDGVDLARERVTNIILEAVQVSRSVNRADFEAPFGVTQPSAAPR